jgi:hypothetical protein
MPDQDDRQHKLAFAHLRLYQGIHHLHKSDFDEAERKIREALETLLETLDPTDPVLARAYIWLGKAIASKGLYTDGMKMHFTVAKILRPLPALDLREVLLGLDLVRYQYCLESFKDAGENLTAFLEMAVKVGAWYPIA